jgi:4-hydroxy-tetrahydrodipicolinate synthase
LYQHFKAVAEASTIPVILYNVPGRTAKNMEPDTSLRLARDIDNIVAIKEAGNSPEQYKALIQNKPKDFMVISGDDDLVCDVVLSGGSGVISVIGQALPALFSNMIHKGISGDEQAAKALEKSAMPLIGLIFEENNPAGIKAVLEQLGLCNDTVRLPLVTATEGLKLKIKNALAEL